ncbi:flagellar motor protein MotB [Paenibacillus hodogayensis]|uniref:Flagellar motor protein MotB n=1 Tax=Paenibacillus hodogayensis TaxID=279208 RepID=A0ABV5W5Z0_9BACL
MNKKHKQHHEEHIDESWLIPYADLLTLLLALFIILFASSEMDSKKYNSIMRSLNSAFTGGSSFFDQPQVVPIMEDPASDLNKKLEEAKQLSEKQGAEQEQIRKETAELQELKQKLDRYIQDNQLTTQLETKLTNDMLMITIRDNALYASGSANVKPEAQKLAVTISDMLTQYPQYQIEVSGHTDNVPIRNAEFETNWDLSAKRALNFMKILLQNDKITANRFRAIGYGEFQPIDSNDTADGRAKNRRVEVSILRTIKSPNVIGADGKKQ